MTWSAADRSSQEREGAMPKLYRAAAIFAGPVRLIVGGLSSKFFDGELSVIVL